MRTCGEVPVSILVGANWTALSLHMTGVVLVPICTGFLMEGRVHMSVWVQTLVQTILDL